ncbi:hypothetical protein [Subtercola lobariae]|uniref:Transcriptional regulator n=1 Tax=Subtercola lobariae TaxID=1588641 RepID=A0A917B5T6_9MICO|nr:hypothetical protein [Subtercola lobariae]GGF24432.1 transcriptional regulator [Subtercola lobariae]
MDISSVRALLQNPGVPAADLARRANVSRNTEWTLRKDPSRANLATLRELALACGQDLVIQTTPASDPLAAAAARSILGDLDESEDDLAPWVDRLIRYAQGSDPLTIAMEAGRVSTPHARRGALLFDGRNDAERLTSAGVASESEWALSGSAALESLSLEPIDPDLPAIIWTSDPERIGHLLGETHRAVRVTSAAKVIVAPLHPTVLVGVTMVDGTPLVTPVQAVIDSFGTGGPLADAALSITKGW